MKFETPKFSAGKVLVVGDLMLDKYWCGDTKRISPEAPVPIVKIDQFKYKAGGAANAALNMATLGSKVTIAGIVGKDTNAEILTTLLVNACVDDQTIQVDNIHTITKLRVLSNNQQLIRLDFEDPLFSIDKTMLTEKIKALIPQHNVLLISDYNKGTLSDVEALIQCANEHQIPVLVDPKGSDFSRYQGATVITPNLSELEVIIGNTVNEDELIRKTNELLDTYNLDSVLITRSENGMTLVNRNGTSLYLPAKAQEVYDVTGAGDTVIATLASCLAVNTELSIACKIANVAAGIAVEKLGTAVITEMELFHAIHSPQQVNAAVLTLEQLSILLEQTEYEHKNTRLLFGSFDILTASHVAFISKLTQQGNKIIVGIIDDETAKKSSFKIVNNLTCRMAVISAMENVGWIIPMNMSDLNEIQKNHPLVSIIKIDEHPEIEQFRLS